MRNSSISFLLILCLLRILLYCSVHAQWIETAEPWGGTVYSFAVSGTSLFVGTDGGVSLSTDNGTSWTLVNNSMTIFVRALVVSGANLFAGTYGGGVFLSTNNGSSWTVMNVGLTNTVVWSLIVSDMNLFAGTEGGVFLSSNDGTSWTAVNTGLTSLFVQSFAVSGTSLFAGTVGAGGGVFLSTNNGTSWTEMNAGLTNTNVWSLAVSGTSLFAGNEDGVFLSTNNGTNWAVVNSDNVTSLAVSDTMVFAGTFGGGVFLSTNNGTSWTSVNTGLTHTFVWRLVVSGTNLFAGTYGNGVWRRPLSEMVTSVSLFSDEIPTEFALDQNFPNPFNPKTAISFHLPATNGGDGQAGLSAVSFVQLTIYDILGREVATLVNEKLAPGAYTRQWDASGLTSGVYFYRLMAGSFTETKRMLLVR